jgi:hypothetical protein
VHRVSNVVCYYAISLGSCSFVSYGIIAMAFIPGASSASLLFSAGYSMHLGDVSISKSLDDSS